MCLIPTSRTNLVSMKELSNHLQEGTITPDILKHMDHCEDLLLLYGQPGAELAYNALSDIFDTIKGSTPKYRVSTKLDGCLDPSTLVQTDEGFKTLKEVSDAWKTHKDIRVKACNLELGKDQMATLSNAITKESHKDWVEVILEDGCVFRCTDDHPVYTQNRGYVPAKDLVCTDKLKTDETLI